MTAIGAASILNRGPCRRRARVRTPDSLRACLIADMATPLCPGAFRFDPAQSIEGVAPRAGAALPSNAEATSLPRYDAFDAAWSQAKRLAPGDLVARLPLRRMLPRVALGPAHLESALPRSSEDG